jgi:mono/diheme cytochrome c family protein
MSPELQQPLPTPAEAAEPQAKPTPVPVVLFILLFLMLYWGMVYFDQHSGWFSPVVYAPYHSTDQLALYQPPTGGPDLLRGKQVYENICGLCHNNDGTGKPGQAPPFVGSEWALGTPHRMIRIPLVGLTGPVEVAGKQYNLSMPAMGAALSNDDLAAVLSYIRSSWGNHASVVTPAEVKAVRAQIGNRTQPWTSAELKAIQ